MIGQKDCFGFSFRQSSENHLIRSTKFSPEMCFWKKKIMNITKDYLKQQTQIEDHHEKTDGENNFSSVGF